MFFKNLAMADATFICSIFSSASILNEFRTKAHQTNCANAPSPVACRQHDEWIGRGMRTDETGACRKLRMRATGLKSELDFAPRFATTKRERLLCPPPRNGGTTAQPGVQR
jgi:hypothetical protein